MNNYQINIYGYIDMCDMDTTLSLKTFYLHLQHRYNQIYVGLNYNM